MIVQKKLNFYTLFTERFLNVKGFINRGVKIDIFYNISVNDFFLQLCSINVRAMPTLQKQKNKLIDVCF